MGGWIFDILVGWLAGSIVGGLIWDVVTGGSGSPIVGVLVGTVGGIYLMRRFRRRDEA